MAGWLWPWRKRCQGVTAAPVAANRRPQQARYDALVRNMTETWQIEVHRWRTRTTGCAWVARDRRGRARKMIEAPYPRGPVSCAVFLHEVGHHALGIRCVRLRCLEEHLAWTWAIEQMEAHGIRVTPRVLARRDAAMRYAVAKAMRRGLKSLPVELKPWCPACALP